MATSDDDKDDLLVETVSGDFPMAKEGATSPNERAADGNAHDEDNLQINPEILQGLEPLPDLDKLEVYLVQPAPIWARVSEGLMVHIVGSGVVAALAFIGGLVFADAATKAESAVKQPSSCTSAPVSAPEKKAE